MVSQSPYTDFNILQTDILYVISGISNSGNADRSDIGGNNTPMSTQLKNLIPFNIPSEVLSVTTSLCSLYPTLTPTLQSSYTPFP